MASRHTRSITRIAEPTADNLDLRDEDVMHALVSAGALVALADGHSAAIERAELVDFIDRQSFTPTITRDEIIEAFDNRVQELEDRHGANAIVQTLRRLAGLSLASVVIRSAERVAAADRRIHSGELRALKLIRQIMMSVPKRPLATSR